MIAFDMTVSGPPFLSSVIFVPWLFSRSLTQSFLASLFLTPSFSLLPFFSPFDFPVQSKKTRIQGDPKRKRAEKIKGAHPHRFHSPTIKSKIFRSQCYYGLENEAKERVFRVF